MVSGIPSLHVRVYRENVVVKVRHNDRMTVKNLTEGLTGDLPSS